MPRSTYLIAAIFAYFLWGFFSFGLKPIAHYPSLDILFFRLFVSVIVLLIISLGFRKKIIKQDIAKIIAFDQPVRKKKLILLFCSTLLLMTNWLSFIYVINHISVKAASLAYLICPILTTLLGFIILKEHLRKEKWIAILISFVSCVLLANGFLHDVIFSILVAATFAIYLILQKQLNMFDSLNLLTIQLLIMSIILLPFFYLSGGKLPEDPIFFGYIGAIVVFFTIIPMFLSNFALKKLPSSTMGILIYINPIINFLLAIFYYKEPISQIQIVAYGLIVLSIIIFNLKILPDSKDSIKA